MTPLDSPPQYLLEETYKVSAFDDFGSQTSHYGKPLEFRVRVPQSAAEWLGGAVAQIQELTALARGWDSYGGMPVDAEAAVGAIRFLLNSAYAELAPPAIVPVANGGIQIEWHRGGVDLEILFSDGRSSVFIEDDANGEVLEDQEGNPVEYLRRFASRLV